MKNLLLVLMVVTNLMSGQITLEHSYPGAGSYSQIMPGGSQGIVNELHIVHLEIDGDKYVHIDRLGKQLKFYNLNHTPFKTISWALAVPVNSLTPIKTILYISQTLFDTDNEIEFMYIDAFGYQASTTQVINEDGSVIFTANNQAPIVYITAPQTHVSIYNTTAGTKMILSEVGGANNGNVYSLTGTLSAVTVKNLEDPKNVSSLFPNPSQNKITLQNENPINKINIIDGSGKIVMLLSADNVKVIDIDVSTLTSGVYFLQVYDTKGVLMENRKIIRE
ncbi:MAG TPA: T9SS type A sorting domain-containing protein [Bacteroidia bacterium]|nr:T9SS type A sorting domain-containing protein [Bacteroidia bacterium]